MKGRIYNGEWAGNHTQHWLDANQDKVIGGQLVSEWTLTEVLPGENLLKPIWNGSEWVEGATPEEIADANKPIVPQVISRRQFKLALAFLGYNENDILNGIEQLPEPNRTIARISYLESVTFERFSSDLIYVGKNFLQLTDEQIDEIFITGNNF